MKSGQFVVVDLIPNYGNCGKEAILKSNQGGYYLWVSEFRIMLPL